MRIPLNNPLYTKETGYMQRLTERLNLITDQQLCSPTSLSILTLGAPADCVESITCCPGPRGTARLGSI